MPAYQFHALLLRIGLALGAGVLIAVVPVALRKTRYEPSIPRRVLFYFLALVALIAFCFYAAYLWKRFVPRAPETPAPVDYPAAPTAPAEPFADAP